MVSIENIGWYIFLVITAAVILYFNWRFLSETKRIQEKMKGMKSFSDIIDATNQALDEFNDAFDEAGKLLETKRKELDSLVQDAEQAIKKLESAKQKIPGSFEPEPSISEPVSPVIEAPDTGEPASDMERVDMIRQYLAQGKTAEEISRMTGASIREVQLVGKFSN